MASTPPDTYVFTSFKIWAMFEGTRIDDIAGISGTFALNGIPSATLTLAAGINAATNKAAAFHTLRAGGRPKLREKVKVYLDITTTDGKKAKMPNVKSMLIFEGYYAGMGYQRSDKSAGFTVNIVHWLDDLNCSSMASGNWFPGAPFDLAESACAYSVGLSDGGAWAVPQMDARGDIINAGTIEGDLWEECLKKLMLKIADWPVPRLRGEGEQKNDAATAALQRMPGKSDSYAPLSLDLAGTLPNNVADGVGQALTRDAADTYAYSTFWSKLVGDWGAQFFFAVSPAVEFAFPIPFFGGLKWESGMKVISADEYNYASFMASTSQILEEVDIFTSVPSQSGLAGRGNPDSARPISNFEPSGWYPKENADRRGMIMLKSLPGWLANYIRPSKYTHESTGQTTSTPGDDKNPDHGAPAPADGDVKEQTKTMADIADRFAEHWYKSELLQQRYGEMSGKLRFDIAPGSIVKIEPPEHVMTALPDSKINMYATVVQVTFAINSEQAQAGTSFSLAHIRTEDENNDTKLTTCEVCGSNRPPLYLKPWKGGPLVTAANPPADFGSEYRGPGGGIRNP
jgi:hypothetical protein